MRDPPSQLKDQLPPLDPKATVSNAIKQKQQQQQQENASTTSLTSSRRSSAAKPITGIRRKSGDGQRGSITETNNEDLVNTLAKSIEALQLARLSNAGGDGIIEKPIISYRPRKSIISGSVSSSVASSRRTSLATEKEKEKTQSREADVGEVIVSQYDEGNNTDSGSVFEDEQPISTEKRFSEYQQEQQQEQQPVIAPKEFDYYEYLKLSQRHSSSNFIQKIDSSEIVWKTEEKTIKMIGSYLLGDQIGKGSFGKVKEGISSETLQRVAIKIINKKRVRKLTNGVSNIIREIKLLKRLKHKNIIGLLDVFCKVTDEMGNTGVFNWFENIESEPILWTLPNGATEERNVEILKWYLVFEYCPVTLQSLLENTEGNRLSEALAHRLFKQLMRGLAYLHSRSVIHRDIKPGNLLITTDGTLKISDFGVAEEFSIFQQQELSLSAFAGTHQFLAPEIADGATEFNGEKIDIWAAGVTLFNMLTGRYPFEITEEGNLLSLYEQIIAAQFEIPDFVSAEIQDMIRGLLKKNPTERFDHEQISRHAWYLQLYPLHLTNQPLMYTYLTNSNSPITPNSPPSVPALQINHQRHASSPRQLMPPANGSAPGQTRSLTRLLSPTSHSQLAAASKKSLASRLSLQPIRPETTKPTTPVTTTLTPFLLELFAEEIEAELDERGNLDQYCWDEGELELAHGTTAEKLKYFWNGLFKTRHSRSNSSTMGGGSGSMKGGSANGSASGSASLTSSPIKASPISE